jgi:hypothetical protein
MTGSSTQPTQPTEPTEEIKTVLHPVSDLARAKPVYTAPPGGLMATFTDPDGNVLGLLQDP